MDKIEPLISRQETGSKSDTHHTVTRNNIPQAQKQFVRACARLKDVNRWHEFAGKASAKFQLTDASGTPVTRLVEKGDYFKIDLPAPKETQGGGYDWVRVEDIITASDPDVSWEALVIRVRPATSPIHEQSDVAHFFDEKATSNFVIQRQAQQVIASVHGRNEHANTSTDNLVDKTRNVMVAIAAMVGLSTPQWKSLVTGILEE